MSKTVGGKGTARDDALSAGDLMPTTVTAGQDLWNGLRECRLWTRLAWLEVRRRYSRTVIGPFWSAISLGVMVVALGSLGTGLWSKRAAEFLPFLAAGWVVWAMVASIVSEACSLFVGNTNLLRQMQLNYSVMAYALVWRNLIVFAHNLLVVVVVSLVFGAPLFTPVTLAALPGLALLLVNGVWISIVLGMLCLRFRDVQQAIVSLLQISMFVTPIFWPPESLRGPAHAVFVDLNPLYHIIVLVRSPLLGEVPAAESYVTVVLMTILGSLLAYRLFGRFRKRIAYWS